MNLLEQKLIDIVFMSQQMTDNIESLKREGTLPSTANIRNIRSCLYGRLNTHLFEYRPKVCES
jgi:hypothetical protein